MNPFRRALIRSLACMLLVAMAATAGLGAQTPVPPVEQARQSAIGVYEVVLRQAVVIAGQKLAQKTREIAPELMLVTEPPIIRGFPLPAGVLHFDVQVPDIGSFSTLVEMSYLLQPQAQPVRQGSARVVANGIVDPDPMGPTAVNADALYSSNLREALIDAMLDSSTVLQLQDNEYLSISASPIEQRNGNPLYRDRKLILSIKGSDLSAFRQSKITREQAKESITDARF